ncbi:MAG: hypothetical protein SGI83_03795, partial [Bacteroidota bacterium]|nr:hypothetical protein [Bacteroidota bacterium]
SRSKGSRLTFRLQNCRDNFQVAADFYSILKKDFKNISYGDTVKISIPSVHEKYLNKGKKLLQVFSVEGNQKIYLNYYDSIRKYNSFLMKFIIGLFLIIGVTALYYRHKSFPPKRKQTMPVQ